MNITFFSSRPLALPGGAMNREESQRLRLERIEQAMGV